LGNKGNKAMTTTEMRELDAWIAWKVFDWQWRYASSSNEYFLAPQKSVAGTLAPNREYKITPKIVQSSCIPNYSTSGGLAIEVLKKCAEHCGNPVLICKWTSKWELWQEGYSLYKENYAAETLELAICLFSRKLFSARAADKAISFGATGQDTAATGADRVREAAEYLGLLSDNEFRGWPPMPDIKPLEPVMSAEELARRLKF